jgi:hypothetical protein
MLFKKYILKFTQVTMTTCFVLLLLTMTGCENKDPSSLKIYVRSASNELVADAQVVIIGDVESDPPTQPHVDTLKTNVSGFAAFPLDEYFENAGEDNPLAYFDVLVKKNNMSGTEYVRCRTHMTAVKTVIIQ